MNKIVLCLIGTLIFATGAQAYELQRAMDNLAEDVSDCVAHFTIISVQASSYAETQKSKEWADIEARYRVSAENAIALLRVTMTGRPEKFMQAKIDLRMQQQIKILKSEGTDRLMVLHADSCKELLENPQEHLKYWTEKE